MSGRRDSEKARETPVWGFCAAGRRERSRRYAMSNYLLVGVGGFFGSIARWWVGVYVSERMGTRFPFGTFVINCSGSFLIGLVVTLLAEKTHWDASWRYLIPIGVLGGYTTFSAFEYETLRLVQDGDYLTAFLNVFLSVVAGFAAVWLGVIIGKLSA